MKNYKSLVNEMKSLYFQLCGKEVQDAQDSNWQIIVSHIQQCCSWYDKLSIEEKQEFLNFIKFLV